MQAMACVLMRSQAAAEASPQLSGPTTLTPPRTAYPLPPLLLLQLLVTMLMLMLMLMLLATRLTLHRLP